MQRTDPRRWVLQVGVGNTAGTTSDLGLLDTNWLEVELSGGWFGEVRPGDFYRFQLLERRPDGTAVRTLRRPDVLRLYAPILAGGRRLTSGPIVVLATAARRPELTYQASFLAPFGGTAEVPRQPWVPVDPSAAAESGGAQPATGSR
jgi:hypothetical protein